MESTFKWIFPGEELHKYTSPLFANDNPEMDTSPECNEADIAKYQSLIGAMQWAVSLDPLFNFDHGEILHSA
jgi:hypothetical protein